MFVQQKQLSMLNVPCSRVAMIFRSGAEIQLALPGLPSQMGSAFLVLLKGAGKVQVLVALYMLKSRCNIFYISDAGEVSIEQADKELEAGLVFAESMGFVLNDTEFSRLSVEKQELYWKSLPICQRSTAPVDEPKPAASQLLKADAETAQLVTGQAVKPVAQSNIVSPPAGLLKKRQKLKEQFGKFLASL
ncbi:hypothetical protein [Geopsychrobacter electrodiphilus]|uniref:hypothetical protein n=1 Tax=Geopsychrobacter electrodiphilus TaxID=225196 RepID=UPI0003755C65|nr:hypothetical protein [Geopsychrobacter electrodiphilus]